MSLARRQFLHLAACVAALPVFSNIARAQEWPTRPVTMVVTFAAGGVNDVVARILAPRMSEILGQQIIIENVAGAGGMTGAVRVAKAPPDGYQFMIGGPGQFAYNQTLYKRPLYNAATDFRPIGLAVEGPFVLITRKDLPASNLQDFISYAKENQHTMQFGSGGAGSGAHLSCALLNSVIGANVTHVPYRGGGPAMQDLQGGRIDYMCDVITTALPQIVGKTVKAIATLALGRTPLLPDLPTADEQGLTNFEAPAWFAFVLPKGTPDTVARRLSKVMGDALDTSAVRERLRDLGLSAVPSERRTPEYLAKFIPSEIEKWAGPIKASGVSMD
jgi:tripartite-type tricarboxylate transporter receptor subunit TctC